MILGGGVVVYPMASEAGEPAESPLDSILTAYTAGLDALVAGDGATTEEEQRRLYTAGVQHLTHGLSLDTQEEDSARNLSYRILLEQYEQRLLVFCPRPFSPAALERATLADLAASGLTPLRRPGALLEAANASLEQHDMEAGVVQLAQAVQLAVRLAARYRGLQRSLLVQFASAAVERLIFLTAPKALAPRKARRAHVPTFSCGVCLERHAVHSPNTLTLQNCGHYVCRESLAGMLAAGIKEHRVQRWTCFALRQQMEPSSGGASPATSGENTPSVSSGGSIGGGSGTAPTPPMPLPASLSQELHVMVRDLAPSQPRSLLRGREQALTAPLPLPLPHDRWECTRCTLHNEATAQQCEACELPRSALPPLLARQPTFRLPGSRNLLLARRGTCGARIDSSDIISALQATPELLEKYQRILALQEPGTVSCPVPACGAVCSVSVSGEGPSEVTCGACGASFCRHHAQAHLGRTCSDFLRLHAEEERATAAALAREGAKPCPSCGMVTIKTEGCNHMTCAAGHCLADWCWLCRMRIGAGGVHSVHDHFSSFCRQFGDGVPGGLVRSPLELRVGRAARWCVAALLNALCIPQSAPVRDEVLGTVREIYGEHVWAPPGNLEDYSAPLRVLLTMALNLPWLLIMPVLLLGLVAVSSLLLLALSAPFAFFPRRVFPRYIPRAVFILSALPLALAALVICPVPLLEAGLWTLLSLAQRACRGGRVCSRDALSMGLLLGPLFAHFVAFVPLLEPLWSWGTEEDD